MKPAEIIAELRRQAKLRNATWPCILLSELMPLCDEFERIEAARLPCECRPGECESKPDRRCRMEEEIKEGEAG